MWSDLRYRLRALFRLRQVEADLDEELRFHLDRQIELYVGQGLSPPEAERRARLNLGGVEQVKEACREARGVSPVETLLRDSRYAIRALRRTPAFTAVVVLSLGLGIGANTAIFSLIDAIMLRSLPVAKPEELKVLARQTGPAISYSFAVQEFRALRDDGRFRGGLAAYAPARLNVQIDGQSEPTAAGQLVSGNYFQVLGVGVALGRTITPGDDVVPDGHPIVVLTDGYWRRRFGADPQVLGRVVTLSGRPFTVVGVTPPGFTGMEVGVAPDLFLPAAMQPSVMPAAENLLTTTARWVTWLQLFGRMDPALAPAKVAASFEPLVRQVQPPPKAGSGPGVPERLLLLPAATGLSDLRRQISQPLVLLLAISGLVLLISCANVANLMLARAATRHPELALRAALGASRRRIVQQLFTESLILAALGGACGLLFATGATQGLLELVSVGRSPVVLDVSPNERLLVFTAAVSLLAGLLSGLAPAWRAGRADLHLALKGLPGRGDRAASGPGTMLVVGQVALCVLLLFGAGLFVGSLAALDARQAGPDRERVVILRIEPRGSDQRGTPGTSERLDGTYRELLQKVRAIPGVVSASLASNSPTSSLHLGSRVTVAAEERRVPSIMAYPGYFQTVGLPLLAGRDLTEDDLRPDSPPVAVVNQTFARQMFPEGNPVGQRYQGAGRTGPRFFSIVGVVADTGLASPRSQVPPLIYQPFLQTNTGRGQMVLHVRAAPGSVPATQVALRREIQRTDPTATIFEAYTLGEEVRRSQVRERLVATLSSFFGALALLLACLGLYGLVAFAVVRRTPELGIRLALGANRRSVVWTVMRGALGLVLLGLALGLAASLLLGGLVREMLAGVLFGRTSTDPGTMAFVALVMVGTAALAGYLPARRASRVDPMRALRAE